MDCTAMRESIQRDASDGISVIIEWTRRSAKASIHEVASRAEMGRENPGKGRLDRNL